MLVVQARGPEFKSPDPREKTGLSGRPLNPSAAWPEEAQGSLGLAGQPVYPNQYTPGSVRDLVSQTMLESN